MKISNFAIACIYFIFFALQYVVYPLNNSLIGNTDAIAHIGIFHDHYNNVKSALGWIENGYIFYPANGMTAYVEIYLGETLLFGLPKLFGFNDAWATFFLIVMLCSLNGLSVFLLVNHNLKNIRASFIAGIIFASSCYMLSNQELLNGLAFFCIPLSLYFFERFFSSGQQRQMVWGWVWLSIAFYFSYYHFIFGVAAVGLLILFRFRKWHLFSRYHMVYALLIFALLIAPNILRLFNSVLTDAYNPVDAIENGPSRFSLSLYSLISPLKHNLIYRYTLNNLDHLSMKMDYKANLGVVCWFLFVLGMIRNWPNKGYYILLFVIFFLVSFGPTLQWGGRSINTPLSLLYEWDMFNRFFRIPGRAFVVANFAIAVIAAMGYLAMEKLPVNRNIIFVLILAVFTLENIPLKAFPEDHRAIFEMPEIYSGIETNGSMPVIAELPSSLFTETGYVNGVSEFSREYRYQYWQTQHHNHIVNGSVSYFPIERMVNNELLIGITDENNLEQLIQNNGINYIIFHKNLILNASEESILPFLRDRNQLLLEMEDDKHVLFKVIPIADSTD